jgi:polysaccharide deacetylase 2 family uncharacterized protein YibQ
MTSLFKPRKQKHRNGPVLTEGRSSQKKNALIVILALIVLFETILLLFFLPKSSVVKPAKTASLKSKESISASSSYKSFQKAAISNQDESKFPGISYLLKGFNAKTKGRIAIVIDDWGYSDRNLSLLEGIKYPLTLAILPFQIYSNKIAKFGHDKGYEIIIHMPMEPAYKEHVDLEPRTLMINMDKNTIRSTLKDAFDNVPYAKGMNNHMGSLATQNENFITEVLRELKKRSLYFLDSYVISSSVANDAAKKLGVKFAKRYIFLDNQSSPEYIRNQLNKLAQKAEKDGKAVGICHDRVNTIKVIKEEIPKLSEQGYKFVFVSEIVE